jgi:uncharacterized protein (TIGR01319 family)
MRASAGTTTTVAVSANGRAPTGVPMVLADFGSTYTKVTVIDSADGRLLAAARHRTTIDTDVLDGFDGALEALEPSVYKLRDAHVLACSSAGGGLRVAVVGLERDLTAEAARLAALSAGARVDTILAGRAPRFAQLEEDVPDIVLVTGGTDGGDSTALLHAAEALAKSALTAPVVLAGNEDAQPRAAKVLRDAGKRVSCAPNVMPAIGVMACEGAHDAIRSEFLRHVIGGKHLSAGSRFTDMVRMPTPDAVRAGVDLLAHGTGARPSVGPVVALDIGGATTDVHSVTAGGRAGDGRERPLLPQPEVMRTVEGDLGLRWNAPGIVAAACEAKLIAPDDAQRLERPALRRSTDPSFVPQTDAEQRIDIELAALAGRIAMLRHAGRLAVSLTPAGASIRREGRDLRDVGRVVATGGVFEHIGPDRIADTVGLACAPADRRLLPRPRSVLADRRYILAAAGLLAADHPEQAMRLLNEHLIALDPRTGDPFP